MNAEEKIKFEKMESNVEQIQSDINTIKMALLGNNMSGDKGLVGKLDAMKIEQDILKSELKILSEERVKNTVYVRIITWLLGVIGVGIITMIINYLK